MIANDLTVCLIDDDPSVLKALDRLLRLAGYQVKAFACPQAFLCAYDPEQVGCLLLDLTMPGMSGMEVQQRLNEIGAHPPIVFLTGQGDISTAVRVLKDGAIHFLTKPVVKAALFEAINEALAIKSADRRSHAEMVLIHSRIALLTPRELEVLKHVVAGKPNKQIAVELGTVEKTIKVHRARVMQKMQAKSLIDLVRLTDRIGLAQ